MNIHNMTFNFMITKQLKLLFIGDSNLTYMNDLKYFIHL